MSHAISQLLQFPGLEGRGETNLSSERKRRTMQTPGIGELANISDISITCHVQLFVCYFTRRETLLPYILR